MNALRAPILRFLLLGSVLLAGVCAAFGARAGGLVISPLRLDFGAAHTTVVVTLSNPSSVPMAVEMEATPWPADAAGQAVGDLVVNPPSAVVMPGRAVTVRVGLVRRPAADQERAYRLYVTELPPPAQVDGAIGLRLRVGLPAFVAPARPERAPLQWAIERGARGAMLVARNGGNVHERVFDLQWQPDGGAPVTLRGPSYVLPGARVEYALPEAAATGPWRLQGRTSAGPFEQSIAAPQMSHETARAVQP